MKKKKILLTGGTGFIGSWLTERWYQNNQITIFDNRRRNAFKFLSKDIQKSVELVQGDIQNINQVRSVVKGKDIIIHLAAIAGASFYEKDPLLTLNVNLFGTVNLLKVLLKSYPGQIIIASSSEVYGPQAVDVSEEDLTCIGPIFEGRWSYAVSKVAADHIAFAYFKKYGMPVAIIRPFNVYGPRQIGEGAISNMLTDGIKDGIIKVTGTGQQKRAWCFISDAVDAIDDICERKIVGECFNIGNPKAYVSILELAKKIIKQIGECRIEFIEGKTSEVLNRRPNIREAQQKLGFKPKVDLSLGLKETYLWWKDNILKF